MAFVLPAAAADASYRGFFGQGDMQKEFEEASFALKPGEISPVIETASGLHLIERYVAIHCATRRFPWLLHSAAHRGTGNGSAWHSMRAAVLMINDRCTDTSLCLDSSNCRAQRIACCAQQRETALMMKGHMPDNTKSVVEMTALHAWQLCYGIGITEKKKALEIWQDKPLDANVNINMPVLSPSAAGSKTGFHCLCVPVLSVATCLYSAPF